MKRAYRRKYHYVYKTTCLITNKYYIGMHSTDDLNDGYVGSGKRLWYSINKHGKENHVCEILEYLPDREQLRKRESELVCETRLTDPLCMNLKVGGEGGFDQINANGVNNSTKTKEQKTKGIIKAWGTISSDPNKLAAHKLRARVQMHELRKEGKTKDFKSGSEHQRLACEASRTPEAIAKKKKAMAENNHGKGAKNSQYDTRWVYSIVTNKSIKINKTELDQYIKDGWIAGRKIKK